MSAEKVKSEMKMAQALCYMCIALNICGVKFNEYTVDLVLRLNDEIAKNGGNVDLKTICKIQEEMRAIYEKIPKV